MAAMGVSREGRGFRAAPAAIGAAACAALVLLPACKKNEQGGQGDPASAEGRRDQAARLAAPASLFGHIPADTPYVFASFEAIPRSYWQRLAPFMQTVLDSVPQTGDATDPPTRFIMALVRDLRAAHLGQGGLEKLLGIGPDGRFAIYGVGIVPTMRLELADGKALLATVERLEKESGLTLPTASVGGHAYWRFGDGEFLAVAAVMGDQLVISAGPAGMVEKGLPFILGVENPAPNMADGGQLRKVAAQHGFAGYGVGYVDANNLLKLLVMAEFLGRAGGESAVPPACMEQMTAMARRLPRLAFGYDEISDRKVAMRMVLETDASLAGRLKQLAVEMPGPVGGQLADRALFAVGFGMDVDKARQLVSDAAEAIGRLSGPCGSQDVAEEMDRARTAISGQLPPGLDKVRGALLAVLAVDLGTDGKPTGVDAYAIVASDDPAVLVALLNRNMPTGRVPDVATDGQFHEVAPAGTAPGLGAVRAAIRPGALVVVAGPRGAEAAERALVRTGTSPLFYLSYDFGQIVDKFMRAARIGQPDVAQKMIPSFFDVISMWAYPTDLGLALAMSAELK